MSAEIQAASLRACLRFPSSRVRLAGMSSQPPSFLSKAKFSCWSMWPQATRITEISSRWNCFRCADPTGRQLAFEALRDTHRTAWDAIGDLPHDVDDPALNIGGRWGDLLPTIPEGQNYPFRTDRGAGRPLFGWRRRYWNFLLELAKNRPAWTIQAQPGTERF